MVANVKLVVYVSFLTASRIPGAVAYLKDTTRLY